MPVFAEQPDSYCEIREKQVEGYGTGKWVLLDFGDIIVHVFDKENRLFYDLERIWRDGRAVEPDELEL